MKKITVLFIASAVLLAGCGKSKKELAAEQAAAAKVQAVAEAAAKKAAGPTEEEKKQAAVAFITLVCSSPKLLDEAETNMDVFEAFSGEGADRTEAENSFTRSQNYYRALLEREMPARGSSYQALMLYANAILPGHAAAESLDGFRGMLKTHCRGVDEAQAERLLGGILFYCAAQTP